ncbi:hypothetical protein B0H13DRAFT_2649450 [Mycena leptocephala]|nr:hypothetical protein B0H13DRAFT_2649450 [Mycena leptocephala]
MYALRQKLVQTKPTLNSAVNLTPALTKETAQLQLDGPLSPLLTLPPEITIEIFIHCLTVPNLFPSPEDAPLLLLQICASWRVLTLSTPALWRRLDMEIPYSLPARGENIEGYIAKWTSHASLTPLSLGFYETVRPIAGQMDALVRQYGPRCESLRLRASIKTISKLTHPYSLPFLRKLSLTYSPGSTSHETVSVRAFTDAPALRELILGQHSVPSMLVLPWHQLTMFTGDTLSVAECLFVLRHSPRLTICTFLYLIPGTAGGERLTHFSLEDLSISNSTADVLRYIDMPALHDLYLTRPTDFGADTLSELFARCAHSLRRLHYAPTYRYRDGASVAWFGAMPQLMELDLSGVGAQFVSGFVRALDRGLASTFLPRLRTLQIQCDWCQVGAELVVALASRCADEGLGPIKVIRLQSFRLVWAEVGWIDPEHGDVLLELVQRGMAIHIGSARENYVCA